MKKILAFLSLMLLFNINVSAASSCNYNEQAELNSKAANVNVSYEVIDSTEEFEDGLANTRVFQIQILNVTEEFYILIKNDVTKEEKTYYSTDAKDGIISFIWDYAETVTNFTIQIYTTNKTNCVDEKYKTIYLTTPRYNEYYNIESCQELSDFYLCQEFVTFSDINRENFLKQLESYRNGEIDISGEEPVVEEPSSTDKIFKFIDDYKWYIIGGVVIIILGSYTVYRIKTKKQRELGL